MDRGSDWNRSPVLLGTADAAPTVCAPVEPAKSQDAEQRLRLLSEGFLRLGADVERNLTFLCNTAARLLGAHCAIYCRLLDGRMYSSGEWQGPRGPGGGTLLDGAVQRQIIAAGELEGRPLILRKLQNTRFVDNDPNVAAHALQTFVGQLVPRGHDAGGTLSVVYPHDHPFDETDKHILTMLAGAIGVEENRRQGQWLESERRQVLEMVALNQPLERILDRLLEMLSRSHPEMPLAALLLREGRLQHAAALNVPEELVEALDLHATHLAGAMQISIARSAEVEEQPITSNILYDPAWQRLREQAMRHGLRTCCTLRIVVGGGDAAGMILAFGRAQDRLSPADLDLLKMAGRLSGLAVEQRQAAEQLVHGAQHDPLTGLPNRVLFEERLQSALAHARRHDQSVGLFFIDLDRFKIINDTLGHHCGDELLHQVSQRFKACIRGSDTLVRLGGDEFGVVLPELKDRGGAIRVAQALLNSLRLPFKIGGHDFHVTASIGICIFPQDATDAADLQRNADTAMYRAKNAGKNAFRCFAPEMNALAMERLALENDLRRAIEQGELQLHYQPLVECRGRIYAAESLIRWNHPKLGMVSPAMFIPLAEETGQIVAIGNWVLHEACRQSQAWRQSGYPAMVIGVNVSALQFAQTDFVEQVMRCLQQTGLPADGLNLEITESMLMRSTQEATRKLNELRRAGVQLAIDDFGTGYSSLAYLQNLPVDTLKIDRSFVKQIPVNEPDLLNDSRTAVIRAITSLAHTLRMRVVAEGVETEPQRAFLEMIGCDGLQGYHFSRPVTAQQMQEWLAQEGGVLPIAKIL